MPQNTMEADTTVTVWPIVEAEDRATSFNDVTVLLPAAGAGTRMGGGIPKALRHLRGQSLLQHAVTRASQASHVSAIVVAAPPDHEDAVAKQLSWCPIVTIITGSDSRQASVAKALNAAPENEIVLVHDAARALTPSTVFERVAAAIRSGADAVVPALPVSDTIKIIDDSGMVTDTPPRAHLRAIQTPQGARRDILLRAHATADHIATDDAGLIERLGVTVHTVTGSPQAVKITHPEDLEWAEHQLDTVQS